MTKPHIRFNLTLHAHQPVGNLQEVNSRCYDSCYGPFLELLDRYPSVPFSYHISGPLLEWVIENRPEHLDLLQGMVSRGQVELIAGAFYEPIVTSIPRRDARAQIELYKQFIRERFGCEVRGMWLPERVWEPSLPSLLKRSGMEFTLVDDTHFLAGGLKRGNLHGYFVTEDQGELLAVFPILESLRYTIPFGEVKDSLNILRHKAETHPGTALCYGDDLEKFGVWPQTYEHCYEKGWLEEFFSALQENSSWIELVPLSGTIDTLPSEGLVSFPDTSYPEMNEWTVPPGMAPFYKKVRKLVKKDPELEPALSFVRGPSWRNFNARYPEIRRLYGRALSISRTLEKLPESELTQKARKELYRGQCNCAYWHGVFGGHYLPHLREGVWNHLLRAENLADSVSEGKPLSVEGQAEPAGDTILQFTDVNLDREDEVHLRNRNIGMIISKKGARVLELDLRPWNLNLFSVLARRKEAYHEDLKSSATKNTGETKSIHEMKRAKSPGLTEALHYDRYEHLGFTDLILTEPPVASQFTRGELHESKLNRKTWSCEAGTENGSRYVTMATGPQEDLPIAITKSFAIQEKTISVNYTVENKGSGRWHRFLAVEIPVALQTGDSPNRVWLDKHGEVIGALGLPIEHLENHLTVADWDHDLGLELDTQGAKLLTYAVKTVSQSEAGFEAVYQNSVLVCVYELNLEPSSAHKWTISLSATRAPARQKAEVKTAPSP